MAKKIEDTFSMNKVKGAVKQFKETSPEDAKLTLSFFTVSFLALLVGGFLGLFQGLERAGLITMPSWFDYYQTLTTHGVLLILVFTGTFLIGYVYAGLSPTLGGLLSKVRKMGWVVFTLMVIVTDIAATPISNHKEYDCDTYL